MSSPQVSSLSLNLLHDPGQLAKHLQSQRAASGTQEFEASIFASVLEKMEQSLSITDEQNSDAGHGTVTALGVRAVSQALAARHVLGIAPMIEKSLGISTSSPAPGSGNGTTPAGLESK